MDNKIKGRNFFITLNQIDKFEDIKNYLLSLKNFSYGLASKEKAPSTGHEHIHIYCQFSSNTALSIHKLSGAHIDKCKGSAQQNIDYIKKKNEPDKRGVLIWDYGIPRYKGGASIKDIRDMSREEREFLPAIYFKAVKEINNEEQAHIRVGELFKQVDVRYVFGPSGLGKTYLVDSWINDLMIDSYDIVCYENGFWNGVSESSQVAFYDDFRDTDMPPVAFIKFIDYAIKILNIKGGFVKNRYRYIFITSIQDPREIYKKVWEEKRQWIRRMKIYEFTAFKEYHQLNAYQV